MELSPQLLNEFTSILRNTFTDRETLVLMLQHQLNIQLSHINLNGPINVILREVVEYFVAQDQVLELAEGALEFDPDNNKLKAFVTKLKSEVAQPTSRKLVENRSRGKAQYFTEDLNGTPLEMVLIPSGSFMMGSPEGEEGSRDNERPQHEVTISQFFMGKYPVTQAQWRAVAAMPPVKRELDPDPSSFKGDNLPVELVSWFEAVEFCDRLSAHTQRSYRLPSEAEWEYACRAGTTTPFHFGETISTEYANYDGRKAYGRGAKGEYRQETTPVGSFRVANRFGLFDMHGNVWEWCADHWHDNYQRAPIDGSAWIEGGDSDRRMLRGGSWVSLPEDCRSAYRGHDDLVVRYYKLGFRLVCSAPRTS